jgi:hypothetical protein
VYGRLDFKGKIPDATFELVVNVESLAPASHEARQSIRLEAIVEQGRIARWDCGLPDNDSVRASMKLPTEEGGVKLALRKNFEFRVPLQWAGAQPDPPDFASHAHSGLHSRLRIRVSLWQNRLPVDALPLEGWLELPLLSEEELHALA